MNNTNMKMASRLKLQRNPFLMEIFFSHLSKQVDTPNKLTPLSMKLYGRKVIIYYENILY